MFGTLLNFKFTFKDIFISTTFFNLVFYARRASIFLSYVNQK